MLTRRGFITGAAALAAIPASARPTVPAAPRRNVVARVTSAVDYSISSLLTNMRFRYFNAMADAFETQEMARHFAECNYDIVRMVMFQWGSSVKPLITPTDVQRDNPGPALRAMATVFRGAARDFNESHAMGGTDSANAINVGASCCTPPADLDVINYVTDNDPTRPEITGDFSQMHLDRLIMARDRAQNQGIIINGMVIGPAQAEISKVLQHAVVTRGGFVVAAETPESIVNTFVRKFRNDIS